MQRIVIIAVLWLSLAGTLRAGEKQVSVMKTPHQGIQPQALVDDEGNLHLLYFQGEARSGNLWYVRRTSGQMAFSAPLRVNSQDGSAIAMGTIRGGHLAVGKKGRVHVVWNGSSQALPRNPIAGEPLLYARLNARGTAFEAQRNVMTRSSVLDGGGSLAADTQGNIYVGWHALGKESIKGEDRRQFWVSISNDEGENFAAEKPAWDRPTGACPCCGVRGFADQKGNVYFVYRAATRKVDRGMYLLHSGDQGKSFAGMSMDQWKIDTCPMSSEAFAEGPGGVYTAWDTRGQIYVARWQAGKSVLDSPQAAPGEADNRKHPALAVNKKGDMILVWTEGTGWNRGGTLAWQMYDHRGHPTAESGRRPGAIPVWGLPAVIAESDGRFTIFH